MAQKIVEIDKINQINFNPYKDTNFYFRDNEGKNHKLLRPFYIGDLRLPEEHNLIACNHYEKFSLAYDKLDIF